MNAYQLAAMRLLLNRNGRHNWSIAPDTEFPEHWTVRDQNGNMAMQLEQWPEGRWQAFIPDNSEETFHTTIGDDESNPRTAEQALVAGLDWIRSNPGQHQPRPGLFGP